jgi:uncharacterized membrane-anchored protein YjiN (DUF445 family)
MANARQLRRERDLGRMRALATGLLVLMALVFVAAEAAPRGWHWPPYVAAFAEAGMVGACADWFAVSALFRRPLGLPIPHTAILPRNKDRIGEALGEFVADNFLDPRLLDEKVIAFEPGQELADWLSDPIRVEALSRRVGALAPEVFRLAPALTELAAEAGRRLAGAGPLAPLASRLLAHVWREAGARGLMDRGLLRLEDYLQAHPDLAQRAAQGRAWSWLPKWIDTILARRLAGGLIGAIHDLRDQNHPVRKAVDAEIETFIRRLADDPDFLARGEALKARWLSEPGALGPVAEIWSDIIAAFEADPAHSREVVAAAARRLLLGVGNWLEQDASARDRVDRWARVLVRGAVSPSREAIGRWISHIVASWDADDVSRRLELQVGPDLQFIRINGALVGGIVGLAIFTIVRLLT